MANTGRATVRDRAGRAWTTGRSVLAARTRRPPPPAPLTRRQRSFTAITIAVGLLLLGLNVALLLADPVPRTDTFFLICLMVVACATFARGIEVKRGRDYVSYQFWEYPAIVGLALAPTAPYLTVVAVSVVYLASMVGRSVSGQHEWSTSLAYFGFASIAITVGAYLAVIYPPWTLILAYSLAAVLFDAFFLVRDHLMVGWTAAWLEWREGWARRNVIPLGLSTVVTGLVVLVGTDREIIMVAPVTILAAYWIIRWRQALSEQQMAWARFEELPQVFVGIDSVHAVISESLRSTIEIFNCDYVELEIFPDRSGGPEVITGVGRWHRGRAETSQLKSDQTPRVDDAANPMPANHYEAPLSVGRNVIGRLSLWWMTEALNEPRERFLRVYAHFVAISIANARHNTRVKLQADEKARAAQIDSLTGLGNREMLFERGPGILEDDRGVITHTALLLLDLDGFKNINDTLGHATGDTVIKEIGRRITDNVRRDDLAVRLGGDEFAILATAMTRQRDAELLAGKIAAALVPPITVDDLALSIEVSIGIAIHHTETDTIDDLLKQADIAMYEAKARGKGQAVVYDPSMHFSTAASLALATDLRRAINVTDELVLHYQPQVDLRTDEILGVEALIRWHHPTKGLLMPDQFVPLAEHSGLVRQFTLYVLRLALQDRLHMRSLLPDATVAVNLSARNLLDRGLPVDVRRALETAGVAPEELVLEVTETTSPSDTRATDRVLSELHRLGCRLAMDDFGSGYATFEAVREQTVPIEEIKIDRAFVRHLDRSEKDQTVVASLIRIAQALHCHVVAEGVENLETMHILSGMGCDAAQGYHLLRPVPLDELLAWAEERAQRGRPEALPDREEAQSAGMDA